MQRGKVGADSEVKLKFAAPPYRATTSNAT